MQIQAFLRGLVVERADDEGQLDAEVIGLVRQGDGLLRGGAAGASDDGLTACGGLDGGLEQLHALVERQQGSFAGGAGDDEGVAEVVRDDVLDQLGILAIVDLFVFVIGGDEREQNLAVFLLEVHCSISSCFFLVSSGSIPCGGCRSFFANSSVRKV